MKKTILVLMCVVMLTGCGRLISGGDMPDEMSVVSGPPLTLPPNFELRPPSEAKKNKAASIRAQNSSADARAALMTTHSSSEGKKSSKSASWLLEKAGTEAANPNIRQELEDGTISK